MLVGFSLSTSLMLLGCGLVHVGPVAGPSTDPGNVHLHQLEHDPIFAKLPPDSKLLGHIIDQPAYFHNEGALGVSAWQGPTVTENFSSTLSLQAVADFVNAWALAAGWKFVGNSSGYPAIWGKKLPGSDVDGGNAANLLLEPSSSEPSSYQLTASI